MTAQLAKYRAFYALLREFEGWRCWWCPMASMLTLIALLALPVIGGIASIELAGTRDRAIVALGVTLAAVLGWAARWLFVKHAWIAPVSWRLRRYEESSDPSEAVLVLIGDGNFREATLLLRRAKLSPSLGRHSPSPADAPQLDLTFSVSPTRSTPTTPDLPGRIAQLLGGSGIEGRAGGVEFGPSTYGVDRPTA